MLRPHRQPREAEPMQQLADRALVQADREPPLDQGLQVDPAPAHHPVPLRVRPPLHDRRQLGPLLRGEARPAPGPGTVAEAGEALGVVAVHPVTQGLPVHAGRPRRGLARAALQHEGERQHATRRPRVPAPARRPSQLDRAQLLPRDPHRHGPSADRLHRRSTAPSATRLRAPRRVSNSGRWYKCRYSASRPRPPFRVMRSSRLRARQPGGRAVAHGWPPSISALAGV